MYLRLDVENASAVKANDWIRILSYGATIDRFYTISTPDIGEPTLEGLEFLRLTAYDNGVPPEAPAQWPEEYSFAETVSGLIVP